MTVWAVGKLIAGYHLDANVVGDQGNDSYISLRDKYNHLLQWTAGLLPMCPLEYMRQLVSGIQRFYYTSILGYVSNPRKSLVSTFLDDLQVSNLKCSTIVYLLMYGLFLDMH